MSKHIRPFHQIDELFDDKIARDLAVDIYKDSDSVIVKMHIPGIEPDKIDISVEDGNLHIAGSRLESLENSDQQSLHREIRYGSFERIVPLPLAVDQTHTRADYHNGVLTVILPTKKLATPSRITISEKKPLNKKQ
jgi:HSP20 family protein